MTSMSFLPETRNPTPVKSGYRKLAHYPALSYSASYSYDRLLHGLPDLPSVPDPKISLFHRKQCQPPSQMTDVFQTETRGWRALWPKSMLNKMSAIIFRAL